MINPVFHLDPDRLGLPLIEVREEFQALKDQGLFEAIHDTSEGADRTSWFYKPSTWNFVMNYDEHKSVCELIHSLIPECTSVDSQFYWQLPNTTVPAHVDVEHVWAAINVMGGTDNGPVCFEPGGLFTYDCALLNVRTTHGVPEWPADRYYVRFNIVGPVADRMPFDEICRRFASYTKSC